MSTGCLALRAAGIGDLLTAVPALRALATVQAAAPVLVAAPAWLSDLVDLVPGVAGTVPTDGLAVRVGARPWLAVNLHGRGPQSHAALVATGPRLMWAYRCPGAWDTGPRWREDEPERDRWCRLLQWHGVPADPAALAVDRPATPSPAPGAVVLHVGGRDERRRLDDTQVGALAAALAREGTRVVVSGGPDDRARAVRLAAAAGLPEDCVLSGRLRLLDLAALVAEARLVVSGDTGAAHLATAYAVPSVVVFGPAQPLRWGPPADGPHVVLRGRGPSPRAGDVPVTRLLAAVADRMAAEVAA